LKFDTKAIHAGQEPDSLTGATTVPIYQTSTFIHQEGSGYVYSRIANPTRTALETCLAALEEAEAGFAFASGMAAEDSVMRLLNPGDHVVMGLDAYGGTRRLFEQVLTRFGLTFTSVDTSSTDGVKAGLRPETKMIWLESPTNPGLQIADIAALCELGHAHGALVVVDNTFATPYLQRPITLGADIVVHSTTKYLGGHSDVLGGAVCVRDSAIAKDLGFIQRAVGAVAGPFDSWLVLRGIKTLGVRMRRHCENAAAVAEFLSAQPSVGRVWYPGFPSHPGHEIATRQMDGFGGMVLFEAASLEEARRIISSTKVFLLAESLGGVESLIGHPASMSHASIAGTPYAVSEKIIRLSVGIEDPEDLIVDLGSALSGSS
jgi:cystathionine gamma-synthase